ncbi:Aspartate/glutamate/uridylate kinase [Roridomyces roridus]|uniref:aspartate kinase n=1 Tax=Roridomyces roridus TaxID=1738132 RepID=A0AAD7FTC8_9AGAR|nr:Aspartate/glutamate/uridylate kinase [Roridomyces roridus]
MSVSSSSSSSRASSLSSSPPRTPPNLHQNSIDPSSKWLVQKFGGTSVGKFPVNIARDIVSNYIDSNKVAIVCSARSGSTKALGTTNLLLRAASEALRRPKTQSGYNTPVNGGIFGRTDEGSQSPPPTSPRPGEAYPWGPASGMTPLNQHADNIPVFHATVDLIREEHFKAAREAVKDAGILQELEAEIERDVEWLRSFLYASQVIDEISPRSKDTIVGLGERLACKIMTAVLRDHGIDAEYVSLENIVPFADDLDDDSSLDQEFYDNLSKTVGERIKQCGSRVPVVTGFFGPVPGSLLRQVGRGYTDLLSALLAVGLEAAELQIWKEVDGIFTADPRKVPTARLISMISPAEAAELTYYGSEVVHPFTMEQAIRQKIPIRIKNVENPRGGGTVIHPDPESETAQPEDDVDSVPEPASPLALAMLSARAAQGSKQHPRHPTAVTIKEHILVLNINSNRKSVSHGFLAGIFSTLDRFGVVVDLISTSEVHVSMAIEDGLSKKILERLLRDLQKSGTVSVHHDMAILSLVGKHMHNMIGIAGRMFTTLAQGKVNIEMISQGASEINISCVIEGQDAVKALNLIHQSCLQLPDSFATSKSMAVGPWLF